MTKILDNFDMAALRKSRSQQNTRTDLIGGLRQISPAIETLKVGQTVEIPTDKITLRKTVMQITAKLNHLTSKGGAWAGKSFDVASNGENKVYVQRGKQVKPEDVKERKKGGGGGRPRKAATDTAPAVTTGTEMQAAA